jgi:hypothetical protein
LARGLVVPEDDLAAAVGGGATQQRLKTFVEAHD